MTNNNNDRDQSAAELREQARQSFARSEQYARIGYPGNAAGQHREGRRLQKQADQIERGAKD